MAIPSKNIRAERITGSLDASGINMSGSFTSITATSFTGSLFGTASFATNASTASFVNPLTQSVSIRGLGATNATNGLKILNSAGTDAFEVRDDAAVKIGPGSYGHPSITRFQVNDTLGNSVLRLDVTSLFVPQNFSNLGTGGLIINGNPTLDLRVGNGNLGTITIGNNTNTIALSNTTRNFVLLNQNWNAISGSLNLTMNALVLNNTINFVSSSGTNLFRGLYVNPILTGVTDFRAIETTTGSVTFGGNTQVTITGSLTVVTGSTVEFQVNQTGVKIGNATTDSHAVTGSVSISSSFSTSGSALTVYKSGSSVLDIQGSQGQLFSVIDALSGSLMSVNDVSGLPILEVFSDDRVVMGTYGAPGLTVSGSLATVATGSSAPAGTAPEGTFRFAVVGGLYYIYAYIGGAWRSGSLS